LLTSFAQEQQPGTQRATAVLANYLLAKALSAIPTWSNDHSYFVTKNIFVCPSSRIKRKIM